MKKTLRKSKLDQHSVIDVACGAMMSFVLNGLVYRAEWREKVSRQKTAMAKKGLGYTVFPEKRRIF